MAEMAYEPMSDDNMPDEDMSLEAELALDVDSWIARMLS